MQKKLKILEGEIKNLETNLYSFDDELKTEFIEEVITKFSGLLTESSIRVASSLRNPLFAPADIFQEFLEYLLRYTYSEVRKRKLATGKLWLPYLKRSIRNCSINLFKKYGKGTLRNPISEAYNIDDFIEDENLISNLVDYTFLFSQVGYEVLKTLDKRDRFIFLIFVYPSVNYIKYLRLKNLKSSKWAMSKYFGIPYSSILKSFKHIKKVFEETVSNINCITYI